MSKQNYLSAEEHVRRMKELRGIGNPWERKKAFEYYIFLSAEEQDEVRKNREGSQLVKALRCRGI